MLHQLINFSKDQEFILACSGGVDSMAVLDFYRRGGKKFTIAYFDHNTGNREGALSVIFEYAIKHNLLVEIGKISSEKPADLSPEEHWRNERYAWLKSFNLPIVTCHHVNDQIENWIFSCLHGNPKLIKSYINIGCDVFRPFLCNSKQQLIDWCTNHQVKWFEDISNRDTKYPRNRIRQNIIPEVLQINKGIMKVIRKKTIEEYRLLIKS